MKKQSVLAALALTLALNAQTSLPVLAADSSVEEHPVTFAFMLPVRLTALAAGLAVGCPVSILRSTANEIPETIETLANDLGDSSDPGALAVAAIPGACAGTVIGLCSGLKNGTINSFENFYDRPFSPESFSLADQYGNE